MSGELVVPESWLQEIAPDVLRRQFAHSPSAVSVRAGTVTFILRSLHVTDAKSAAERVPGRAAAPAGC